ncbi:unnamed protein product [Adineta steineri]|uniref:EF-hand domain-containing protein n=1 Tax=Adineta steineri TaxID=433720 RepID=A0A818WDB8_9BILA|nr:unnamed protein product [Adineta steineri]
MKLIINLLCFFIIIITIGAPPVADNRRNEKLQAASNNNNNNQNQDDVLDDLEYGRYLKEVVDILESDPAFKEKIQRASVDDIKSGNIAEHLSLVQHHVRSKLDEAKQREMSRLRDLVGQKFRNMNDKQRQAFARADPNGRRMQEFLPQHLDHKNWETFGQDDLERLIRHASKDLDELDRKREEEFKQYEIRKEYERRAKLAKLNIDERKRLEQLHRATLEKKKKHRPVNHPGSVDQMEEVWEKVDKLEADQFKPKAFFKLHDVNSDGLIDEDELDAIMVKEADKIYEATPDADPVEREEEIDRMREHVMKEFDKNNDRMLTLDEFEHGLKGTGAKNDQGWKSIEDNDVFSDQEFQRFSEKMAPVSTSIPHYQTPSPASNQQEHVPPEVAVQPPPAAPPANNQQQQQVLPNMPVQSQNQTSSQPPKLMRRSP